MARNEDALFDAPMIDPDEMEVRPVLQPGQHGIDQTATLLVLEGRKGKRWENSSRTWLEDPSNPVAHMEILVIDPVVGPIRLFHDESVGSRANSRFPKWATRLGFPRDQLKGSTIGQVAEFLQLPLKVVVDVTLNSKGDRNNLKDILPLE